MGVNAVDGEDGITGSQPCLLCRPAFVGVGDAGVFSVELDESAYATVFAGGHEFIVFDFRFRDEHGVGIQAFEHGVDGGFVEFSRVDFVNIVQVQLPKQAVVDIETLGDLEVVLLFLSHTSDGHHHAHQQINPKPISHLIFYVLNISKF